MISHKNIIIVGGNAAGPAAAAKAKRVSPDCRVIMFEAGEFISTGTCELPYVLSGEINDYKDIVFFSAESFHKNKGVEVFTSHYVELIDRRNKRISVRNLKDNSNYTFEYDKLILTTGSSVNKIPSLNYSYENLFHLKTVSDYIKIKNYLDSNNVKRVLIIGGGYIGLEGAEAFKKLKYDVTIVEKTNLPMPGYDKEVRNLILDELTQNGVEFISEIEELKFSSRNNKITSINIDGRQKEFDLVLSAIGVQPNNDLGHSARLNIGDYNGLKVDKKQKTSDPNIYAAGDNTEVINKITNRPDYMPLATIAQQQGHVAGANAAGDNLFFEPVVKNIAVKIFNRVFVAIGLNYNEASQYRFNVKSVDGVVPNLVHVMPNSSNVYGKINYDPGSKLVLGASFFGSGEVIGFGDIISTYIHNKIEASKLAEVNYNYTPPFSPFINLLSVLGRKIKKEIR